MRPMLARPIEADQQALDGKDEWDIPLLRKPEWAAQEKCDGKRLVVSCHGRVKAYNRDGERTDLPRALTADFADIAGLNITIDGEWMGDFYWVFDLPVAGDLISPGSPWDERQAALAALIDSWRPDCVHFLGSARTTASKRRLARRIWETGREGLILKHCTSSYQPGKRTGVWLKLKNVKTVDCVVMTVGFEGKHSLELGLYDNGELVPIGSCSSLEGQAPLAIKDSVLEVAFLHSGKNRAAPRLNQAHARRLRFDKRAADCTIDQLEGTHHVLIMKGS